MTNPFDELMASRQGDAAPGAPAQGAPADPTTEQPGVVRRVARDVAMGTVMAVPEAARGALTGLQETAQTFRGIADALPGGSTPESAQGQPRWQRYLNRPLDAVSDGLGAARDLIPSSETTTGGLVNGVSQFLSANLVGGRVLRAFGLGNVGGRVTQSIARDTVGSAIAFDPREDRLSNLLRDHAGLRDPVTAFLAADESDGEASARFKSALENGGLGALAEGMFHALRAIRAARAGDAATAHAADEAAAAAVGPEEARRIVSEEVKVRETREAWVRQTHRETVEDLGETVTDGPSSTRTRTVSERPEGGPREPEMVVEPVGGAGRVSPSRMSEKDAAAVLQGWERARANPEAIDRDTALIVWRNVDRMETPDDAIKLMQQLQERFLPLYDNARGESISLDQQRANAMRIATTAVDAISTSSHQRRQILESLAARHEDVRHAAAEAEAARAMSAILQKRLTERADEVIRIINHGKGAEAANRDQVMADFMRDASFLNNIDALQGGMGTAFGRALAMRRSIFHDAPSPHADGDIVRMGERGKSKVTERTTTTTREGRTAEREGTRVTIEDIIEGGERFVLETAYRIRYAKNTKQARQIVAKSLEGPGAWDAAGEYWMGSLLSSAKTFVVGGLSSTLRTFVQNPAEKALAGLLQGTVGRLTGGVIGGGTDFHMLRESFHQYRGYMSALREATSLSYQAMKNGDSIFDPALTQVERRGGAFQASTFNAGDDTMHGWLINSLGTLSRAPTNLLVAQDEFFKVLHYRGSIYAQARREGADMGLSGQTMKDHIEARLNASYDGAKPTNDAALAGARNITFTDEFGEGFISRMGEAVQAAKARNGALQIVLPFVRVPTNVLREGMTYNPVVALMQKEFRQELAAGGDRAGMAWARLGTATGASLLLFDLASQGLITGNGPTDPKARRVWQEWGWQPNSVMLRQPDGSVQAVSYVRFDPYATLLSVAASMAELSQELGADTREAKLDDAIMLTVLGTAKALASRTYATGVMQFADMLGGSSGNGQAAMNALASTLVPAAARDLAVLGYDNRAMHEVRNMLDAMKVRTPAHGEVDPRRNALGHIVSLPAGWAGDAGEVLPEALLQAISPAAMRTRSTDPLANELLRLQQQHYAVFAPPSKNPGGVGVDLTRFRHSEGGTAYGRLQELVGTVKVGGRTVEERLRDFVTSDRYQRLTDGTADINGTRLQAVQATFADYHAAALHALRRENKEVDTAIRDRERLVNRVQREGADAAFARARQRPMTLETLFADQP